MKEFNIYSQSESLNVLETYIKGREIVDETKQNELREFIKALYGQGIFLGHEGEIIPHLSRNLT